MNRCLRTHKSCTSEGQPRLPKRVLLIQAIQDGSIRVRLVEPDQECAAFAALSHCWGPEQTCVTTVNTLQDRKKNIPWDSIPTTFKDAIIYALKCDINYLWIDSLCIIQDDASDWEMESSRMADIYQYASLTLAATSSSGDSQGCFFKEKYEGHLEINLPQDVGTCRIAVRRPLKHWNNLTPTLLKKHFPLLSRGWAFQERLLAPRILHFCESELIWECRETTTCECGGLGERTSPGADYHNVIKQCEEQKRHEAIILQTELDKIMALQLQQEEDDWEIAAQLQQRNIEAEVFSDDDDSNTRSAIDRSEYILPAAMYQEGRPNVQSAQTYEPVQSTDPNADLERPHRARNASEPSSYREGVGDAMIAGNFSGIREHFHRVVEKYSSLSLTKPSDRLPALSGLCRRIQHLRGEYTAGLWSDSICSDLLWRVNTLSLDAENAGRPLRYRGPSWSWVSVESPIAYWSDIVNLNDEADYFRSQTEPNALQEIDDYVPPVLSGIPLGWKPQPVHTKVLLPGLNLFGEVTAAVLTAEASSKTAILRYTYASYWHGQTNSLDAARYKLQVTNEERGGTMSTFEIPFFADYALAFDGPHQVKEGTQLTLLLVHPRVSLVLREKFEDGTPVMVDEELAWERVGIARISDALINYYGFNWMRLAEVVRFKIV